MRISDWSSDVCSSDLRHLAENRPLVIAALGNARNHALGIENAGLVGNVAALDAGGLFDEGGAGLGQRLDLAGLDGSGILPVEAMTVGVEGQIVSASCRERVCQSV